jgi:hypothetical protein
MGNIQIHAIPLWSFADDPPPPAGSAVDQTTTAGQPETNLVVFGGLNGDDASEEYLSQSIKNTRAPMTGFGIVGGYVGAVTEPLMMGIARTQINPNQQQPPPAWEKVGQILPGDIEPNTYYFLYADFSSEPVAIAPNTTFYLIVATNQNYNEGEDNYWAWGGFTTNPYANGKIMVMPDNSGWIDWYNGALDGMFWTWTKTGGATCTSHTTQPTCVAAGCYWYNNSCHSDPPTCSSYTSQTTCQAAGCYWCNGVCQAAPCGTDCSTYVTNPQCIAAGCKWCSDGTCKSDCGGGTNCEDIKLKAQCTSPCFWYQKYFWESEKCHSNEQNIIVDYLPIIIGGVVAVAVVGVLITVLSKRKQPQYYPQPQYPPPYQPPYQPPPQRGSQRRY